MNNGIGPGPVNGRSLYAASAEQTAWREKMLAQALQKVRETAVATETLPTVSRAASRIKGGYVDKYV